MHFETEDAATQACEKVNGMLLAGKKVYVGPFLPRKDVSSDGPERKFTNVFVKNFGDEYDDDKLMAAFSKFGDISSAKVMMDPDKGKSKGFAFVCFKEAADAENCCAQMNELELLNGRRLFVGRAQKKAERQAELRDRFERAKQERMTRYQQGVNLYVKNLDDTIEEEKLRAEFAPFGNITSVKVMTDGSGRSKGFGFVCFSTPEEATKAVTEMNGKIVVSKPLYVALAQRKEDRKAHLASQYMQRLASYRLQGALPGSSGQFLAQAAAPGYFVPTMAAATTQPRFGAAAIHQPSQLAALRGPQPRWGSGQPQMMLPGGGQPTRPPVGYGNHLAAARGSGAAPRPQVPPASRHLPPQSTTAVQPTAAAARAITGGQPGPVRHATNAPRPTAQQSTTAVQPRATTTAAAAFPSSAEALRVANQEPLTTSMLAAAPNQEQKQMLGERLYPLIHELYPTLAGKITGMLLEIDNSELLHMLESRDALKAKVDEAVAVLHAHQAKLTGSGTTAAATNGEAAPDQK